MKSKRDRNQYKHKRTTIENFNKNRRQEYRHCDQLSEKDLGITEYLGTLEGFSGIIKARYSDFQLNEINLDGNVAKLTNTNIPKGISLKMIKYNYNEVNESPNKNIPQETWEAMKAVVISSTNSEPLTLNIEHLDKEARTEIHNCIKSYFGQKIIASTIHIDNKRHIQFKKFDKEIKQDIRFQWPIDKGEYVYFIVYKEKMDTLEATFKLSSALNMKDTKFTHAGNKDRRSITSQWFCVKKVEPSKLINKTRHLFNIRIGNVEFKDEPLKLGQLKGNKFRIALRNVIASQEVIDAAMTYLKENGFINYYGLQRFGNDKDVPTFQIGISLLQGKWKEAIDLILKPKSSDDPFSPQRDIVEAKKIYSETGDARKAYEALLRNKSSSVEGKLLEGLKHCGKQDYVNALEKIPRTMRLLYLHAFQSLIWNKMVSKRLQVYGMKPVVGDLVILNMGVLVEEAENDVKEEKNEKEIKDRKQVKSLTQEDLRNYSIYDVVLPLPGYDVVYPEHMKSFYKESIEEYELNLEMTKQKVKSPQSNFHLFLENLLNLLDVLPIKSRKFLSGDFNINFANVCATQKYLVNIFESFNLTMHVDSPTRFTKTTSTILDYIISGFLPADVVHSVVGTDHDVVLAKFVIPQKSQNRNRTYNLAGGYRLILSNAENLTWSMITYNSPTDNLILSDLQEMKGETLIQTVENGKYRAIILEFSLSACSYATMVLRQIMKIDTATNVHAKLNDYHLDQEKKANKITVESSFENQPNEDDSISNSLLTNPDKYEQFKNSIFDIVSEGTKSDSPADDDDAECPAKKQKLDANKIKTDVLT